MARRALIVGRGVGDRIAAGLHHWEIERNPGRATPIDLVVWADYAPSSLVPQPLADLTPQAWYEACDEPLRRAIELAREVHPRLRGGGTVVFLVPLMASAGGAHYTALATVGEGVRIMAKSLAKTWGPDGITAHAITLDPHAFLAPTDAAGIAEANALHDPPFGRVPDDTTEIAPILDWLASTPATPLTGASLVIDGGLWMPG